MAFGTITVTESTFGSISGTVVGAIPGTLSGSVGVPGPQGPAGSQGPQGPAGAAGVGVPAGGTAGQFLTKIDGTNYNTDWTTINLSAYAVKANNLSDLTNVVTARNNLGLGATNSVTFGSVDCISGNELLSAGPTSIQIQNTTYGFTDPNIPSASVYSNIASNALDIYRRTWAEESDWPSTIDTKQRITYDLSDGFGTLTLLSQASAASSPVQLSIKPTGITFPNASVQTIAFPGFNDAALTGNPTAPTAALGDNDTSIATTAFVQQELASGTAVAKNLEVRVRNQSGSTMAAGTIVYISGATGNLPLITKAQANNDANSAQTIGFVKTSIANNGTGYVIVRGELENIDTSALTEGVQLYLSPTTAGTWTTTKPSAPQHLVYVGVVIRSHPTLGTILVAVQNGYELHELHDVALASEANNDLLVYELSTDLWKNKSFATLGLATLASPAFTGTPSLPTGTTAVTQSVNDNSTKLVTTAGLLDMLSDCTWSAPPISTTTTATSGTGATYTNVPPDFGYLNGPNVNTAGFCQKGIQMFARSNSSYGFNYTKEMRIACKMAANWNGTFTGITYTLIQRLGNSGNGALAGVGFGISINMATKVLSILAHNGTTLTTKTTSWAVPFAGIASVDFMVKSDGTGTVYAYADGVLIDSTTGMSTATTSANTSMFAAVEINSAGGTSTANAIGYISNLRTFVAHG
jgi:hypothetical protein